MSNKSYLKVAATAITLALLVASMFAIFPTFFTKAAVPTTYTTTVVNLSNQTALTGLPSSAGVRVYLWNSSESPPVQIAYADVGANGQVTFSGLPTYVWNNKVYAISANLTWNGADKGVLLLPRTIIYDGTGATPGLYPLATLLSTYSSLYTPSSRTYNGYTVGKKDSSHDFVVVQLSHFAFQVLDQGNYPATGASVQAFLNLTTHEVLDFGANFVNGTFGSEFTGLMPGAGANTGVGWVDIVLPAPETITGTTFNNITLLVRYKAKDPTNGPVVGRALINNFDYSSSTDLTSGYTSYKSGITINAAVGSIPYTLTPTTNNYLSSNIKWVYVAFKDIMGNDWLTHKAEIYFKWYENPNGAYSYGGSTYDYGKAIVRIPSTLIDTTSYNFAPFNFTLTYGVEWFFSLVGEGNRVLPSTITGTSTSPWSVITKMVKLSGIRMVSSAEIPQPLRSDLSINLFLPAVQAYPNGVPVNLSWATNGTGYVVSPDPGPSGNTSIWLPSSDIGQINFQAWYQGVKVLDTGVSGVVPAGTEPLSLTTADYGTQKNYSLAIYELGFVLNFYDGQSLTPVPSGIPFFFNHPGLGLIGPTTVTGQGVYDLIKAAPGGTYSNFFIFFNGSFVKAENASITLSSNSPNLLLVFKAYNLNMSVWSQEPFNIVGVKVRLYSETNLSQVGLPAYRLNQIFSSSLFSSAAFPTGWTYTITYNPDGTPYIKYWTIEQTTGTTGVFFGLLPPKSYDVWVHVPASPNDARNAGFREMDANATLYWSKDPYPGVGPINLTQNLVLQLSSYVYNPKFLIKDAGGNTLTFDNKSSSAFFIVEPWFTSQYPNLFSGTLLTNYLVRVNETDSSGAITVPSINETGTNYPYGCRFMIGNSTWQPANGYRVMIYYKGVLVYNASVTLSNPYQSKENSIITSVYPYVLRITNNPLDSKDKFGIANLNVSVAWAGLNTTWWPTKDLVTWKAATEFSLINATLLEKGFNLTVVKRMWGPVQNTSFVVTTAPPYYSDAYFVTNGVTDSDGNFRLLIPVWNATTEAPIYTSSNALKFEASAAPYPGNLSSGTYPPQTTGAFFGTPIFANWTTIPGKTNNIPSTDVVRLAATLYNQKDTTLGTAVFSSIVRALNATGLYNATSYSSTNKSYGLSAGKFNSTAPEIGFQGRSNVGPTNASTYPNFYAYVEVYAPANDLGVVVYDFLNGTDNYQHDLPNQLVLIAPNNDTTNAPKYYTPIYRGNYSWLTNWGLSTTTLRLVYIKSTPNNILWGFYPIAVLSSSATNLSSPPSPNEISNFKSYTITHSGISVYGGVGGYVMSQELRPQWIAKFLPGGEVDWSTQVVVLQWPAKLFIQVFAGDGVRPLYNPPYESWVYIKDVSTSFNVSAAVTDSNGVASVLTGLNYTKLVQTGSDPTHDPFVEVSPQAATAKLVTGFNLLPGTYIVFVNYKGSTVWDTFRDQPQHRFIYLGVAPPPTSTGEDNRSSQTRTFTTKVFDLSVKVTDTSGKALSGATVEIPVLNENKTSNETGVISFELEPAGTYNVNVKYASHFGPVSASQLVSLDTTKTVEVTLPLYYVAVKLVSPRGAPLTTAVITIQNGYGSFSGTPDQSGTLVIPYAMPAGTYSVKASWFGADVSPTTPLNIVGSQTYTLVAGNIATVTVQVLGAQNQGLPGATVTIGPITGVTTGDGTFVTEIPYGTYTITASYKGVSASQSATISGDTTVTLRTGTFIELFGQSLTFASFVLWIIAVIVIVLILIIAAQEYNIYRRKKLPQLFGAGPK